jgi:cell division protein FtsW (lipid II flippase)
MSEQASPEDQSARRAEEASGWAVGFISFAAIVMLMVGMLQILAGLVAIFENEVYVQTRSYLFEFDVTTWGWIHLILGVIVALAGWGLLSGRTWARVVGITLAVLSAIANFLFLPHYPLWSLLIIALDVLVIWALAAHGQEIRDARY